jgi:hypothetical protein
MAKKTLSIAILSALFVTGAYAAEVDFKRIDPWTVIIYKSDTSKDSNIVKEKNVSGIYSPEVSFKRIDPWTVIITRDTDMKVKATKLTHSQYFAGFQPFMATHYPKFDFDHDGSLSRDECREGMQQLDAS